MEEVSASELQNVCVVMFEAMNSKKVEWADEKPLERKAILRRHHRKTPTTPRLVT